MKLPKTLNVCGYVYSVLSEEPVDRGTVGDCDSDKAEIIVSPKICLHRQQVILMHEALHAAADFIGLTDEVSKEEEIVSRLANVMVAILKSNPRVVEFWVQKE
jgi:hypothetical protein